jgi:hypothetical protein
VAALQTGADSPNAPFLFRPFHAGECLLLRCLPGRRSDAVLIIPNSVTAMAMGSLDGWSVLRHCDSQLDRGRNLSIRPLIDYDSASKIAQLYFVG